MLLSTAVIGTGLCCYLAWKIRNIWRCNNLFETKQNGEFVIIEGKIISQDPRPVEAFTSYSCSSEKRTVTTESVVHRGLYYDTIESKTVTFDMPVVHKINPIFSCSYDVKISQDETSEGMEGTENTTRLGFSTIQSVCTGSTRDQEYQYANYNRRKKEVLNNSNVTVLGKWNEQKKKINVIYIGDKDRVYWRFLNKYYWVKPGWIFATVLNAVGLMFLPFADFCMIFAFEFGIYVLLRTSLFGQPRFHNF